MDLDILRRSPLFATLDDAAFKLLTDDITEIDLSRNAVLFYEETPATSSTPYSPARLSLAAPPPMGVKT